MLDAASATAFLAALTCLIAAALVAQLARVPDWDDLKPLVWVALTAALLTAVNIPDTLDVSPQVHVWSDRIQAAAMMLHVAAWIAYLPGWAKRPEPLPWWTKAPIVLGLLALFPGAVFSDTIVRRPVPWLGVVYQDPVLTTTGLVSAAIVAGAGVGGMVIMARWGRAGAPYPRAHLLALGSFFLFFIHDVLVLAGVPLPTPYLQNLACFAMMIVFGVITLRRVSGNAIEFHRLRGSLETAIVDRTRRLEDSQAALASAERLAALGQFSAGVANELNPPASAVAANLQLLEAALAGDSRDEVRHAMAHARRSVQRILALARQLLLAGRSSSPGGSLEAVNLAEALEPALAAARARTEDRAVLTVTVPSDLWVSAQRPALAQLLTHLLVNAVHAIPTLRTGTVSVRAEGDAARVRVVVEDDGVGMSEEELRHVFEPFHGAKAPGQGTGLGLAVARNLATGMQATLRFESRVGAGTRAALELQRAEPPGAEPEPERTPAPDERPLVLVIDDDAQVLRSMARLMGRRYDVVTAPGVKEALEAVEARAFDMILCDVMMPAGGGERFWAELLVRRPALMKRVVFMTGGLATEQARAFVRRQPRPLLVKPFEVSALDELLRAIRRSGAPRPPEPPEHTPVGRILRRR
jgi:signal transduction histidine kinase/ActR/RegA family two-component response regulator